MRIVKYLFFITLIPVFSCGVNSDKLDKSTNEILEDSLSENTLSSTDTNSYLVSDHLKPVELLVSKSYFNQKFLSELNDVFNADSAVLKKEYELSYNIKLEIFSDDHYFYLVINNEGQRNVLHGSEVIHCEALFGELSVIMDNSFIWSYAAGCGSGSKRTWIEYDFEGEFMYSTNELLWVNKELSIILFKVLYHESEIFGYNTRTDNFWKAFKLRNEETFYDSYNWKFSVVDDNTIQGVYHSGINDTIVIDLEN